MLDADPHADVDEGQVGAENVRAQWHDHNEPTGEGERDEQEPGERGGAEVAPEARTARLD